MSKLGLENFAKLMTLIGILYSKPIEEQLAEYFWMELKDYDIDELYEALRRHMSDEYHRSRRPNPGDLKLYLDKDNEYIALNAWDKVLIAINRPGIYASVVFDDPVIHSVIYAMGGWILFCKLTDKSKPFIRNEFIQRYRRLYKQKNNLKFPNHLPGLCEHHNLTNGYKYTRVFFLGNHERAELVYKSGIDAITLLDPIKIYALEKPKDASDI